MPKKSEIEWVENVVPLPDSDSTMKEVKRGTKRGKHMSREEKNLYTKMLKETQGDKRKNQFKENQANVKKKMMK